MAELKLDWTGERMLSSVENGATPEHLHRYAIALEYIQDKVVVDIACGEGYGTNLLSTKAKKVIGIDISEETIKFARNKYSSANCEFFAAQAFNTGLPASSVDVIVSFETIEHLHEQNEMLLEFKRIMKKDGVLIISSPDKRNYSEIPNYKNPFHVKELYEDEFKRLISSFFENVFFGGQKCFYNSLIYFQEATSLNFYKGDYQYIDDSLENFPMYNIAIASDSTLTYEPNSSIFEYNRIFQLIQENQIRELKRIDEKYISVLNSKSFLIGNYILTPFRFIFNLLKLIK